MILKKNKPVILLLQHFLKRWMGILLICWLPMTFSGYAKADQVISDLKVLSLQVVLQTEDFLSTGSPASLEALKNSQEKLQKTLTVLEKDYTNHNHVAKGDINLVLHDGQAFSTNLDLILRHQDSLSDLSSLQRRVAALIPGIQAEYNLMTDIMARKKYSADQVLVAKNQVFLAERILRSLQNISKMDRETSENVIDFLSDVEILDTYLQAQRKGSAELGVKQVKDPELIECLQSIQDKMPILNAGAQQMFKKQGSFIVAYQAIMDNKSVSVELLNALEKLD